MVVAVVVVCVNVKERRWWSEGLLLILDRHESSGLFQEAPPAGLSVQLTLKKIKE